MLTTGATVLHYSGHAEEACIHFEDGSGASHELTPPLLGETCGHPGADGNARAPDSLRLVFLCACHSQVAAAAFVKLGVPHVIAVQSSAKLEDQAAVKFTRHLYLALAGGKAVKFAFEAGQKAVASMPKNQTPGTSGMKEAPKFQLMGAGDPTHGHDVPIFIDLPDGTVNDTSPTLCPSNLPVLSEHFVGRQTHMHSAVKELLSARRRYVCIVGAGGIGKTRPRRRALPPAAPRQRRRSPRRRRRARRLRR